MTARRIITTTKKFEDWIVQKAYPLWTGTGIDQESGAAHEQLDQEGRPRTAIDKRMRVQARQIFSICMAVHMQWMESEKAKKAVTRMQAFMADKGMHPDFPEMYAHRLSASDQVIDKKIDAYDVAFFMLANSWVYRVFSDSTALERAQEIFNYLRNNLLSPDGGFFEGDYDAPCRRQNPHMHLFEALLSLYESTDNSFFLEEANKIFLLFKNHFFSEKDGVLLEYFENDWTPIKKGQVVEPGHMYEWVWLLRWYEKLSGESLDNYISTLYNNANKYGFDLETGLLFDGLSVDKVPVDRKKRCWPITELIKAHVVQAESQVEGAEEKVADAIDILFKYFLSEKVPGSYCDHYDQDNNLIVAYAPASSLYHISMACSEAVRYVRNN